MIGNLDHFALGLVLGVALTVLAVLARAVHHRRAPLVLVTLAKGGKRVVLSVRRNRASITPRVALGVSQDLIIAAKLIMPLKRVPAAKVRGRRVEEALRPASEQVIIPPYAGKTPGPMVVS